jgi:deazaflavin-dependent oxidoreductase (nitroreductase family)
MVSARGAIEAMSTSRWFRRWGPPIIPRLDRAVHRITGGRLLMSQGMITCLVLTTTGRRTGLPRSVPLACLPDSDGSFLVVTSNFGRHQEPAWSANLLHDPQATVSYRGAGLAVAARELGPQDVAAVWPRLVRMWPPYARYGKIAGRELRVFRLVPGEPAARAR